MAVTGMPEKEMMARIRQQLQDAQDPVEKLRYLCLQRGVNGIRGLARTFRVLDDSTDKKLDMNELKTGLADYGITMDREELQAMFTQLDKDGSGSIDFNEFLLALRPPMSASRLALVSEAFQKLDKSGDGFVTVEDLRGVYNAKHHPQYQNGELTEDQIFEKFIANFDAPNEQDSKITLDDFEQYYAGVSSSIDEDVYFDLMMRKAWGL